MKWIAIVLGALALLVGLLALVGALLPREHRSSVRVRLRAAPGAVFARLADADAYPRWRPDVKAVRRVAPIDGREAWVEDSKHGEIAYAVEAREPPLRQVLRIADDSLPYGGTWTFALAPWSGGGADAAGSAASEGSQVGTLLTITEDGFVRNVLFRALARFAFGHHATMEAYALALGRSFGEEVTPERVE